MIKKTIKLILKYPIKLVNNIYAFFYYKKNSINPNYKVDDMMDGNKKIIVFSPHVDDETIGLGGTLLKHRKEGNEIILVYLTDGGGSTSDSSRQELVSQRKEEGEVLRETYGLDKVYFLDEADGVLDSSDKGLLRKIKDILVEENPDLIYTPFLIDGHRDHVETTKALIKSLKRWKDNFENIYLYEVNCPIDPKLINSISPMDKEIYREKTKIYNVFSSQSVMGFSVFSLLDRRRSLLIDRGYGAEGFIRANLLQLLEMENILSKEGFKPEQFRQLSSDFNLFLAFERNKKLKSRYSESIIYLLD